jgi:deoxyribodipyrimidine photo-lyase
LSKLSISIVWLRQDLRLDDNPALQAAIRRGAALPVYVWAPETGDRWLPGAASRWWLHHSLERLAASLEHLGSRLVIIRGDPASALALTARETGADSVLWNRCYEPAAVKTEHRVSRVLESAGIRTESFAGSLLFDPDAVRTTQGQPFKVFTPFWRSCLAFPSPPGAVPAPRELPPLDSWPSSLPLRDLELLPRSDWASGFRNAWTPGETGAAAALEAFLAGPAASYASGRNRPDARGTSRLSPHFHFGEISPRRVWHETVQQASPNAKSGENRDTDEFLRQLVWREFACHLLHHSPHTPDFPLRPEFADFPWREDAEALDAWREGRTGYPFVDAGMRELWTTGWMHNRVRMVVASFLIKDLLIDWREGAKWFWDTLVDADLANNTLGWQWVAGCGADAAPFFRIFNPVLQGEKFDPGGAYVRRWVPELLSLPDRWIHRPWEAPGSVIERAGVVLGKTYPRPVVDHASARGRALDSFARIRRRQ